MAKLRIQGDSSGYVDLEAPNTASSSTVNVDEIAQTNQNNTFTGGDGTVQTILTTGNQASLKLNSPSTNNDWTITNEGNIDRLRFMVTDEVGTRFPMYMHTAGYVTMPSQPAFSIYGDTNPNWTSDVIYIGHTGSGAAAFDTNIGNHFSYTTGKFTAPVAGTYFFSFRASTNDANSHFIDIHKNGVRVGGHTLQYGYAYMTATNTCVLTLASGDYIEARRRAANYSLYSVNFSGFLIG